MGTIVINQTDCKQNIVLQSSVDGITGGYYDKEGNWHTIGGDEGPKYVYALDDLYMMSGASAKKSSGEPHQLGIFLNDYAKRRCFAVNKGVLPYWLMYSTGTVSQENSYLYPIPIPEDAKKVTISISPAERYIGPALLSFDDSTKYTYELDPGWSQGTYTKTFNPGEYQYLTVASKYDEAGTSYPSDPEDISIVFEK